MADNYESTSVWSQREFLEIVWPNIQVVCGGGVIQSCELNKENKTDNDLDTIAGWDAYQVNDFGMRGIACRIQRIEEGMRPYDTFTYRIQRDNGQRTEYEKRLLAIDKGYAYPELTVHAYTSNGNFIDAAIVNTKFLIKELERCMKETKGKLYGYGNPDGRPYLKRNNNNMDGDKGNATFAAIPWMYLQRIDRSNIWIIDLRYDIEDDDGLIFEQGQLF